MLLLGGAPRLANHRLKLGGGGDEGPGRQGATVLLDHQTQFVEAESQTPERLGHGHGRPAEFGGALPRLVDSRAVLDDLADQTQRALLFEDRAHGPLQLRLLFAEIEVHEWLALFCYQLWSSGRTSFEKSCRLCSAVSTSMPP